MEEEKIFKVKRIYIKKWNDLLKVWVESDLPIIEHDNIEVPISNSVYFNSQNDDEPVMIIGIECK